VTVEWLQSKGDPASFRKTHNIPEDKRLLLFLSRLHPGKGVLELVDAFAAVRDALADWQLVLAGREEDAAYVRKVRSQIIRHRLQSRVHLVGQLGMSDKRDGLAAAEVLVLPTFHDSFGVVVAEALGVGVPVLTTKGAIAWQALEDQQCGWRIPNGTAFLADALRRVGALPADALAEMGQRGSAYVRQNFRWDQAATRSIEVYRWMLGEAPRPDFVIV
jgi:glycosyltransferase involved in cell wall biosynthesis